MIDAELLKEAQKRLPKSTFDGKMLHWPRLVGCMYCFIESDEEYAEACFDLLDRMEAVGFGTEIQGSSEMKLARCICLIPITPVSQTVHRGTTRTEAILRLFVAVMPVIEPEGDKK